MKKKIMESMRFKTEFGKINGKKISVWKNNIP